MNREMTIVFVIAWGLLALIKFWRANNTTELYPMRVEPDSDLTRAMEEMLSIGDAYRDKGDYKQALEYYQRVLDKEDEYDEVNYYIDAFTQANMNMGKIYRDAKDYAKAFPYLDYASAQWNNHEVSALAYLWTGQMYYYDQGIDPEITFDRLEEAFDRFEAVLEYKKINPSAAAEATVWLTQMYYYGDGVVQDYKKALKYAKEAANQDDNPHAAAIAQEWLMCDKENITWPKIQ